MSNDRTIFVSIAAYRDAELEHTVRDLFERAKHPENLHIAICWQYNPLREEPFTIADRKHQVSVVNINYKKSHGVGWARRVLQTLYGGEAYYLQVDSHSRFIPHWDEAMINELARCNSPKPILSTYPDHYTLPNNLLDQGPYKLVFNTFHGNVPLFHSRHLTDAEKLAPSPSLIASAGFLFTRAQAILDVPYDPYVYFIGEEIGMSVRYWTHGYDFFTPTKTLMFHLYATPDVMAEKNFHWKDRPDWHDGYEIASRERILQLLGIATTTNSRATQHLERYGLGTARTVAQYEAFAGISFRDQTYSDNAKNGIPSL